MKTLIKNGIIHNHNDSFKSDILIEDEIIVDISDSISSNSADKTIDAENMYVLPGGVDVHTHLNLQLWERKVSDGFFEGTKAAAFGGTTTIVDHPEGCDTECSLLTKPNEYRKKLEKEAVIDFGIHGVFQRADAEIINEIPLLIEKGYYSSKIYTTYDLMLNYDEIEIVLKNMKKYGGLTCFHAEDNEILKSYREKYLNHKNLSPELHPLSRPDYAESVAIKKICKLAKKYDTEVYIVHLSSAIGLEQIENAISNNTKVIAETCAQYLLLDDSYYLQDDGLKYVMSPPLRNKSDIKALWKGIEKGLIKVIATDHCSFSYKDKLKYGKDNVFNCPGGIPGVETRMPLIFNETVNKRNISINKFVELCCANPAKIMGFFDKKGSIEKGKDADIVIWNPNLKKKISVNNLRQKCDYTPFENFEVTGCPITTMVRGNVIVDNGIFYGEKGFGKFIFRKK